jgi:GTP-binding protein HflX
MGGEGEQQIELDRRIVRQKIEKLKKELKEIQVSRKEQKKKRSRKAVTAALVGYTNAGKSSLMNRLCRVNVLEEDKLFATLDSTYRMLNPDTHPPMILIDTVGFLSNLPNTLIDGFKTTLESAQEADLLLIVCDISDPHYKKHLEVTFSVLDELGLKERDRIIIFNKKDLLKDELKAKIIKRSYPNSFLISSFDEKQISKLRSDIVTFFLDKQQFYELFIPYSDGNAHTKVLANTNINKTTHYDSGTFYKIRVPSFLFEGLNLQPFVLGPKHKYS